MGKFVPTPLSDELVARAEARHGRVLRFTLPLRPDLSVDFMVRPFTTESWDAHYDAQAEAPDDALINTFTRHILWPVGAELDKLVNAFGLLPGTVIAAMTQHAGATGARIDQLDEQTPDAILADAHLAREDAQKIVDQADGLVNLALIKLSTGDALVVRAPGYRDLSRIQRAFAKKKGTAAAFRQATLDATAWSSRPISELLASAPAAPHVVTFELMRLGGAGADAQFLGGADGARGATG